MRAEKNGETLTIYLSGRIDSANADAVEQEVRDLAEQPGIGALVFDIDDLVYISSAGLRILLRLLKTHRSLKAINASTEVYEIFEMTGFSEMMTVEKAYKKVDLTGCTVIGNGANGKIYRSLKEPDKIIKAYLNPNSLSDIEKERQLARKALILGVPTAIPYNIVRVGNSYGAVFELLEAYSLQEILQKDPEKLEYCVQTSVDLLKIIHETELQEGDMPDMRETAIGWAAFTADYLPRETGDKLKKLVEAVPENLHMMHGDYHIKNVMVQNGEALLIDMDTLCYGDPVFELASMYNAYIAFNELKKPGEPLFLGVTLDECRYFWKRSLELYFGTQDEKVLSEIEKKAAVVGYTRLLRRLVRRNGLDTEDGKKEIELYRTHLIELLAEVETLSI